MVDQVTFSEPTQQLPRKSGLDHAQRDFLTAEVTRGYLVYDSKRYTLKQTMTLVVTVNKAEMVIRELEDKTR